MTQKARQQPRPLAWPFPATTTHDGIPLGNGLFGALLWGDDQMLHLTINRADYWDHRGGTDFGPEATYENLRRWLTKGDESELRRVFEGQGMAQTGEPERPTRLPMGSLDFALGQDLSVQGGSLDLATGTASIDLCGAAPLTLSAVMPRGRALLAVRLEGFAATRLTMTSHPADAPEVRDYGQRYGLPQPEIRQAPDRGGWVQSLPQDPALAVAWRRVATPDGNAEFFAAAEYGQTADEAWRKALAQVEWACQQGYTALADAEAAWWRTYWRNTASVSLPDAELQELYELGMYKLPGISWPGTPAATLQGPWVEEYRMPPWSSDYHFNINVQECYWPAYGGNQLCSLEPLWQMIQSWLPKLRANAQQFLGVEDGLMLNHAVDDRCTCMGGFWTGSIDHGSTAWVAQMMWLHYRYSMDVGFLADIAYPFMKGAMRVYQAMLERDERGQWSLPVSVSPEYEGSAMWAWGRNASFQLAIIHFLCRALIQAAKLLDCDADLVEQWQEIDQNMPLGSIGDAGELYLWDGQPLAHSHRHHSHLAGLHPFDIFAPWESDADRELIESSMRTWTRIGKGEWTGWCVPWASILWSRMHQGERAALLLKEFAHTFRRPGKATTHDAMIPGWTVFDRRPDVMQVEATMAASTAVMEMLLHTASGVMYIFPAVPQNWQEASFDGLLTEGAFLVSAERHDGATRWVRIVSQASAHLRLAPWHRPTVVQSTGYAESIIWSGESILERDLVAGEVLYLTSAETD